MKKIAQYFSALLTSVVFSVPVVNAVIIQYDDANDFLAAIAPGFYLEDFSSNTAGQGFSSGEVFSNGEFGFTATTSNNSELYRSSNDAPFTPWLSTFREEVSITFTFAGDNVTAFGANFWVTEISETPMDGTISVSLNGQAAIDLPSSSSGTPVFLGFVSTDDTFFETLTISTTTSVGFVTIGNVHTGVAIPEPSVYALLLGFVGAGFVIWRRRKA